jgi:hypothetical protein
VTLIDIDYALYTNDGGGYEPVTEPADLEIQTALVDADTDKRVEQFANQQQQEAALHAHVVAVPFPLPVDGHVIAFDDADPSNLNPRTGRWDQVTQGASLVYPVVPETEDPANARLFLRVWTVNVA